jgi:hypothetical protein
MEEPGLFELSFDRGRNDDLSVKRAQEAETTDLVKVGER